MNAPMQDIVAAVVGQVLEALGRPSPAGEAGPLAALLPPEDLRLAAAVRERLPQARVRCDPAGHGPRPDFYVIPELSCSEMVDLAQGRASCLALARVLPHMTVIAPCDSAQTRKAVLAAVDCLAMAGVLDLLLAGNAVRTLGFAYRAHEATAPEALWRLYQGYEAALASYGLTELPPAAPEALLSRRELVAAAHVTEAVRQGARVLRVPRRAVVTPLAREAAAEQHLTILQNL